FGQEHGYYYFSMPRVDGPNLASRLEADPLSIPESVDMVCQLSSALQYAHEHGIVHRDLKPANILLDTNQQPRITDFGLARHMDVDDELTVTGELLGTPAYMSPEQATGHANQVSETTDIFALGSILYLLITGRPAFQSRTPLTTLSQVIHSDPVPPRHLNRRIPRDLETICLQCLQKRPEKRYPSAAALELDLRAFLAGDSIAARPVTRLQRAGRWCRRRPVVAGLSVALAIVILSSVVGGSYAAFHYFRLNSQHLDLRFQAQDQNDRFNDEQKQAHRDRDAVEDEVNRAKQNTTRTRRQLYETRIELALSSWQDGNLARARKVLNTQQPHKNQVDYRHFEWYWLRRMCLATQFFETAKGPTLIVDFHPSGDRLASVVDGRTEATVWQPEARRKLLTLKHARRVVGVRFSPDGRKIATSTAAGEIVMWEPETGNRIWQANRHWWPWTRLITSTLRFTSDGQQLIWASGSANIVKIWNSDTGQLHRAFAFGKSEATNYLCSDPHAQFLAIATRSGPVEIWEVSSGRQIARWTPEGGPCNHMAWNTDGSLLAVSQANQEIGVFEPLTGKCMWSARSQHGSVAQLRFRPHDVILAARNSDNSVTLWNARNGQSIATIKLGDQPLTQISFTPGGSRLLTATGSKQTYSQLSLWPVLGTRAARVLAHPSARPTWLATSPVGTWLAVAMEHGLPKETCSLHLWKLERAVSNADPQTTQHVIPLPSTPLHGSFSGDGQRLTLLFRDGRITEWDVGSGHEVRRSTTSVDAQNVTALRSDGRESVTGNSNGRVTMVEIASGRRIVEFSAHDGPLADIKLSPDGNRLLTVGPSTLKLWGLPAANLLWSQERPGNTTNCQAFSADGNTLVMAVGGSRLDVIDAESGDVLQTISVGRTQPNRICVSRNGSRIVTIDAEQVAWIWNGMTGRALCRLPDRGGVVTHAAFSSDDHWLVFASDNGTLRWYDGRPDDPHIHEAPREGDARTQSSAAASVIHNPAKSGK
ncbi:MAG: serine/threonine-protein kinase, partial [Planctomycetaceae bacterium]